MRALCVQGGHGPRSENFRGITALEHPSLTARDTQRGGVTRLGPLSKLAAQPGLDLGLRTHPRGARWLRGGWQDPGQVRRARDSYGLCRTSRMLRGGRKACSGSGSLLTGCLVSPRHSCHARGCRSTLAQDVGRRTIFPFEDAVGFIRVVSPVLDE